jgi:hypothetical protein
MDGSLSLLDFTINVNNDIPIIKPFIKDIRSSIFIAGDTALPSSMKRNIILKEWNRIKARCGTTR